VFTAAKGDKSAGNPQNQTYIVYCQRRNEPRLQLTFTENLVKFGHVVFFKICTWTDRDGQTDRQTNSRTDTKMPILYIPRRGKVTNTSPKNKQI